MGNRFFVIVMVVLLVLCFLTEETSGKVELENGKRILCSYCYPGIRKLLKRSTGEVVKYFGKLVPPGGKNKEEETVAWSLRNAPSGPNPLHHNGSPMKPQTP